MASLQKFACFEQMGTVKRDAFIAAMRGVASSVSVVTTAGPAGRHGATVSAFCSVSADPPAVLVCLRADSRIARSVTANGAFCLNVLAEPCSDVAARFAGCHDDAVDDRFDGIAHDDAPTHGPAIDDATVFRCELGETTDFGSHRIFVGRVVDLRAGSSPPLTYLDGAYRCIARH
jgi:flavin reductase (DIM6/NTAB) family NADH-FMN oxidoreductase RutF